MRKLVVLLLALAAFPASAATLKISTWNLDWLTTRPTGDPALPSDVRTRRPQDWSALAAYARHLDADVVAFEEVDGRKAAARVFPPDRYNLVLTHDRVIQRVGFAIRRGIAYRRHPDLTALVPYPDARYPLRSGADITLNVGGTKLRLLALHLKTGCWDVPLQTRSYACDTLRRQIAPLRAWIAARDAHATPFVVLGDFNRVMDANPDFTRAMDPDFGPSRLALLRADAGFGNPCWGGEYPHFIDHILLGGPARAWLVAHSLRVMVYRQKNQAWKNRLSDHCPVSIGLNVP
ncbi:MAG: endonuclease/exonuclease/phosphatase family protein [Rhodospirillales bacterium]|nr:endonuclease/exonuclease/phosphatase family protein [Rhodospirillales bacterium]